jgi:hypothetical protein
MLERLNLPKMALCATLINVMKLTKGVPLFAFPRSFSPKLVNLLRPALCVPKWMVGAAGLEPATSCV